MKMFMYFDKLIKQYLIIKLIMCMYMHAHICKLRYCTRNATKKLHV
jgi:hypothetical protein